MTTFCGVSSSANPGGGAPSRVSARPHAWRASGTARVMVYRYPSWVCLMVWGVHSAAKGRPWESPRKAVFEHQGLHGGRGEGAVPRLRARGRAPAAQPRGPLAHAPGGQVPAERPCARVEAVSEAAHPCAGRSPRHGAAPRRGHPVPHVRVDARCLFRYVTTYTRFIRCRVPSSTEILYTCSFAMIQWIWGRRILLGPLLTGALAGSCESWSTVVSFSAFVTFARTV